MFDDRGYPLVMTNSLLLKMAIEIGDLPNSKMVIFHNFMSVSQRLTMKKTDPMHLKALTTPSLALGKAKPT